MTKEKQFFLQVVCDHINGNKTKSHFDLEWDIIKLYAKQQQMEGIFYAQTKNKDFLPAFSAAVCCASNRDELLKNLLPELNMPYFIIKGSEIAEYYPVPALRTMGDIDIVVEDRSIAHKVMIKQGFTNITKYPDREWQYYKMNMEFEIHDRLVYKEPINISLQEMFFNDFWKYVENDKLDLNFHFVFLVYHLKKHFMNSGVGFRQFVDLAMLIKNAELNWKWIEIKLEEIELINFARVVFAFIKRWFNISAPIELAVIDDRFYEDATSTIFKNGIFGFDNEDNEDAMNINVGIVQGKKGQLLLAIRKIFPSYQIMRNIKKYSFVDRRPFLLPVAWLYRFICVRKKISSNINEVSDFFPSNEKAENRKSMYRQWGL